METSKRTVGNVELTVHTARTIVIGAGVAALNAAERLHELGHDDIIVVTDTVGGTSSDAAAAKSAYYRMGMAWETPDSPTAFAQTLCEGGMTHGDVAYVEAVNSIPAFLHHVSNGVPFPRDEFGVFIGYGEHQRTTSAGPLTSALMADKSAVRVRQIILVADKKSYVITCEALAELYNDCVGDFEKILNSFRLISPTTDKAGEQLNAFVSAR